MPPIPLHIEDPITPSKAQGITPQTQADSQPPPSFLPATTTSATSTSSYPAARPGAAAVPAPTAAVPKPVPQPTRTYVPPDLSDLPAAPQPGAVPIANAAAYHSNTQSIPPPPPQTTWAAPQANYAPTHSTEITSAATTTTTQRTGPTTLNLGPVITGSAHPPGYQQNVFAQEMNSQQRASLDQQEEREKNAAGVSVFGGLTSAAPSTTAATEAAENVWESVKALGSKAGEGAAKVHGEVWKWIDGKT